MEQRYYTFLIFPAAHGKHRKIQLPHYIAHVILAFSVVGLLTVAALANSYARMLLKVSNYNSLRTEREALKTQYRNLQSVFRQTNAKLDSLQGLAAEVVLTYGFGDPWRPGFPDGLLAMTAQNPSTFDSSYRTSFYAFEVMKQAAEGSKGGTAAANLMMTRLQTDRPTVPSVWPVRGLITAGFGQRMDPFSGEGAFHSGLDISAPYGTGVEASAEGLVLYAGPDQGYGNEILIDHGYGIKTKYGHLSQIDVVVGQEVKRGQMIGAVGTSGKATGPHLHYEVLVQETPVNPSRYLHG